MLQPGLLRYMIIVCKDKFVHYPSPAYHVDNPVGQPWKEMSPVLSDALSIPPSGIVPSAIGSD